MNELDWLADPSHRRKVVAKPIYQLTALSNTISICTKLDAMRIKKYFGYMIKTNRNKRISEIVRSSKTVVEHLFGNHEFCDEKWCRLKLNARLKNKEKVVSHIIDAKKRIKNCILKSGRRINRSQHQLD